MIEVISQVNSYREDYGAAIAFLVVFDACKESKIDIKSKQTSHKTLKRKKEKFQKTKKNMEIHKGVDLNLGSTSEFDSDFERY